MAYNKTTWEDLPSTNTPLNATNLNNIENGIDNATKQISKSTDEYSSSATYFVGSLCIYNNKIYKCNTNIRTPENWNSSHWDETSITKEINEDFRFKDRGNITDFNQLLQKGFYQINFTNGTNAPSSNIYGVLAVFPCSTYISQMIIGREGTTCKAYTREWGGSNWTSWTEL